MVKLYSLAKFIILYKQASPKMHFFLSDFINTYGTYVYFYVKHLLLNRCYDFKKH